MSHLVKRAAPYFEGTVWSNASKSFKNVNLHDFKGKNLLILFYPLNWTFVCPTEINELDKNLAKFKEMNTEVLVCSVDSQHSHKAWSEAPRENGGFAGTLELDMLSDLSKKISADYGVLFNDSIALRATVMIGDDQVVKHVSCNDTDVGRNMDEYVRLVDAYNYVKKHGDVCPATWKKEGDAVMSGAMNDKTKDYFKNFHKK